VPKTETAPLTDADIEAGYKNETWQGHGYLGTRRLAFGDVPLKRIALADETILRIGNEKRWTPEQFFDWMNSKHGRWYGEAFFWGPPSVLDRDIEKTAVLVK
jgi:hypothetical protein